MILPESRSFRLNSRRRLEAENAMLRYQLIVLQRQLRSYPAVPLFSLVTSATSRGSFPALCIRLFTTRQRLVRVVGLGRQDLALKRRQRAGLGWLRLADAWPSRMRRMTTVTCARRGTGTLWIVATPIEPGVGSRGWQAQQHPQPAPSCCPTVAPSGGQADTHWKAPPCHGARQEPTYALQQAAPLIRSPRRRWRAATAAR